ncbi:hypothetical protein FSP39_009357 [Pinctada imbricata]|uniref:Uncharacterized protein n=1 Tax=Pinctada imbricata TaxID=66713 RepID=A0AA88YBY8_PINIB|nr:hypothetical protein FSP39_009357 [Pinctada imbricata]
MDVRNSKAGKLDSGQPEQNRNFKELNYMHNPPTIMPNLGKKRRSVLPKTKVSRVLLYDNVTQQQMLDVKLSHINIEKTRASRLLDLHKKSFMARQKRRQQRLQETNVTLPDIDSKRENLEQNVSRLSKRSAASSHPGLRTEGTEEIESTLKLPAIDNSDSKRHVIFKLKDSNGQTQVFHTIDEDNIFSDIVPLHTFYEKTTQDPRFQGLENSLKKIEIPSDGFNELSPSFKRELTVYPEHLQIYFSDLALTF